MKRRSAPKNAAQPSNAGSDMNRRSDCEREPALARILLLDAVVHDAQLSYGVSQHPALFGRVFNLNDGGLIDVAGQTPELLMRPECLDRAFAEWTEARERSRAKSPACDRRRRPMDHRQAALRLKLLASVERLKLLQVMGEREGLSVKALATIARVEYVNATDHLRKLLAACILTRRMEAPRQSIYKLTPELHRLLHAISPARLKGAAFRRIAKWVDGLANWDRLRMIKLLLTKDRTRRALQTHCGIKYTLAVEHIQRLRRAGIVKRRMDGSQFVYHLVEPARCRAILDCLQVTDRPTMIQRMRLEYGARRQAG